MRSLVAFTEINAEETFKICISKVKSESLKKKYLMCIPDVKKSSYVYLNLAGNSTLFTFKDEMFKNIDLTSKEINSIYKDRMARSNSPGYSVYKSIFRLAKRRVCPICGHRKVTTLDHYLPKSIYPSLVVNPINLIPSCFDCNKLKSSKVSNSSEKETLHPYFDDLGSERFLFAEIKDNKNPVIDFYIDPPSSWDKLLQKRVINHFETFNLNELYRTHAIDDIFGRRNAWKMLNPISLRNHLNELSESFLEVNVNNWEVAFYEGMANSDWFCEGGFMEIEE